MRPVSLLSVLATVLWTVLVPSPAAPSPASPSSESSSEHSAVPDAARVERKLLGQVNGVRRRAGCRRLQTRAALHDSAAAHSAAMAAQRTLSHQVPGESRLEDRIAAAGFGDAVLVGEVVATGQPSARGALRSWLASPPHRALLLDCRLRLAGVGVHAGGGELWWTVDLVRPR